MFLEVNVIKALKVKILLDAYQQSTGHTLYSRAKICHSVE